MDIALLQLLNLIKKKTPWCSSEDGANETSLEEMLCEKKDAKKISLGSLGDSMKQESEMRNDDRSFDEKGNFVCLGVNMNLNDIFNYPLPKPYITSHIKTYLII